MRFSCSLFACCTKPKVVEGRPEQMPEKCWKQEHPAANAVRDLYEAETARRRESQQSNEQRESDELRRHEDALAEEIYRRTSEEEERRSADSRRSQEPTVSVGEAISSQESWQRKSEEEARKKPVLATRPRRYSADSVSRGSDGSQNSLGSHASRRSSGSVHELLTSPRVPNKPRSRPRPPAMPTIVAYE